MLAIAALGGCAADDPPLELAACDAPEVFRIDRVALPLDDAGARSLGVDLSPDEAVGVDNWLGRVLVTLDAEFQPLDVAAVASARVGGEVAWRLASRACGDRVAISLGRGDRLDEVQLVGPAGAGTLAARGAGGELPLSLMFDPAAAVADPGWLSGARVGIELDRAADGARFSARLGIALDPAAVLDTIVPPVARFFEAHLEPGSFLVEYLDVDGDGRITERELREGAVVRSALAPDLDVDGAPALSFGLGISGARVP